MISPMHGKHPPYALRSNVVYFHDWRYVNPGAYRWLGADGSAVPMWAVDPVPPMRYHFVDMPLGIELVAQRARKTEPVLTPGQAKEIFLFGGTLIHEGGRYRLWYDCWPQEGFGWPNMGMFNHVRYAESDNAVDWTLPSLGIIERDGTKDNNIVLGPSLTPETGYHGGCVFRDPSAPPAERYKAFYLGLVTPEALEKYRRERPGEIDALSDAQGMWGAVSPDGLHWTPLPDPLVMQSSDTHNVCEYDVELGQYVAYCRTWFFHRRSIGRMASGDFRRLPLPEELFWPDASMKPYETWYANAKTLVPGTTDYHVMFPMRWSLPEDKFDFHLASSPDNIVWNFVPGGPVCEPGDPGTWDGGVVAPGLGMVELPGDRVGILMAGSPVPHKHPRKPPLGALAWAWWPRGRLVALRAEVEGAFALWPLTFTGRTAHVNARTAVAGFVRVEAAGPDGEALPGRSFDDCDAFNGDQLDHVVTWRGESDLGHPDGGPVTLRFRMRSADLYAVEFG